MVDLKSIKAVDPELYESMVEELRRQQHNLELIASENIVSPAVMAAAGSFYTNKYAEGYPRKRYYGGCQFVDRAEELAIERAKELFGVKFANVQAHSGSNANFAVYYAVLKPGDTVLGMSLSEGGHLTHGSPVNLSGKLFNFVSYGLDPATGRIDFADVRKKALECKPKLIVAGASAYARTIEFDKFRAIADEVGAYFMVDIAHIAGLVAAGLHPSPVPYADFVTSTTHKTLRGPRGGLIMTNNEELAKLIDKTIFPGSQGGPLMHIIAAKAVAFSKSIRSRWSPMPRLLRRRCFPRASTSSAAARTTTSCSSISSGRASRANSWRNGWTRRTSPSTRTPSPTIPKNPSSPAASG